MGDKKKKYWGNIKDSIDTLSEGLKLTLKHIKDSTNSREDHSIADKNYFDDADGIFTVQYPKESMTVPDNGRYRLHNEIDDCIVCDKCAKVCPVNCIEIEPIKAVDDIGSTSDGTKKRIHAAKFDIDMGKCCFCGLCTTVCPTECLTMTKSYDFSVFDIKEHNYSFAEMSDEEIKDAKWKVVAQEKEKLEKKAAMPPIEKATDKPKTSVAKPGSFKPRVQVKPKAKPKEESKESDSSDTSEQKPKPKFRPRIPQKNEDGKGEQDESKPVDDSLKPKFRPKMMPRKPKKR
ncbi:MAG: 4Fe-4S binding protein [Bacteroidota bacterium]